MMFKNVIKNRFLGAASAACFVGLMSGIAISWSSPVIPKLQTLSKDNPFDQPVTVLESSWMTSLVTLGSSAGCCIFGFISHYLGRRFAMIALPVTMALGHILMVVFPKLEVFYLARFLLGVTEGGGQTTTMAYNSEITSKSNRGVFMTFASMMVSVGSLIGYCIGPWVTVNMFNIILAFVPILAILMAIVFCLETPYFYLIKNKEEQAREALLAYRGAKIDLETEMNEIKENIKEQQRGNLRDVIKTKGFKKSFVIATGLLIFQQFTGINGILMYAQPLFDLTGSNFSSAVCSIIIGAIQVVSGGVAPLVADRFDRKTLLISSSAGMALSQTILGIFCILNDSGSDVQSLKFIPVISLCFFIFSYNFGIGPLCWIVGSEVYATRVKSLAMSVSIFTYHIFGFVITRYFNAAIDIVGIGQLFIIFAGFCLICIVFVQFYVVETKCKSLEQIQNELNDVKDLQIN